VPRNALNYAKVSRRARLAVRLGFSSSVSAGWPAASTLSAALRYLAEALVSVSVYRKLIWSGSCFRY
jgi:hypothetical protein